MAFLSHIHGFHLRTKFILAGALLVGSAGLLMMHVKRVGDMRDVGLPAALTIPALEQRMEILKEQADVAQLQASVNGSSSAEMLRMYVMPSADNLERLLGTIDALSASLRSAGDLSSMSAVTVGEGTSKTITLDDGSTSQVTLTPVTFDADVSEQGMKTLFLFEQVSGLFTVGDALTPDEQATLLRLTEDENPAAVTSLEAFLSTDLFTYARDPQQIENKLLQSFTTAAFADSIRSITRESKLPAAAELLGGAVGQSLVRQKLWPLRFLTSSNAAFTQKSEKTYRVSVTWEAVSRD